MTSCDHLGSPRHVTDGGLCAPDGTMMTQGTGQMVGEQAFGPYGEQMIGEFNGKRFPSGYRPVTGYTGHINEEQTGLIYMRGRYYSPLWHRFVNSDQGADPNSLNQYAYVGGRPFSATDPSGMTWVLTAQYMPALDYYAYGPDGLLHESGHSPGYWYNIRWVWVPDPPGGGSPEWRPSGGGPAGPGAPAAGPTAPEVPKANTDCEKYAAALAARALEVRREFPFTGSFRFGSEMYERAITDIALSSFGLAPTYSGFKDILVSGGQNDGVYRHVSASIGVSMMAGGNPLLGGTLLTLRTLRRELPEYYLDHSTQAVPEIRGNYAGLLLTPAFDSFFYLRTSEERLEKAIRSLLCEK